MAHPDMRFRSPILPKAQPAVKIGRLVQMERPEANGKTKPPGLGDDIKKYSGPDSEALKAMRAAEQSRYLSASCFSAIRMVANYAACPHP